MRGVAIKLAQKLNSMRNLMLVNPELQAAFDKRVLNQATAMPHSQVAEVLSQQLGENWRKQFSSFNRHPFAAASLGQVHTAALHTDAAAEGHDADEEEPVALKIQYPVRRPSPTRGPSP